MLLPPTETEQYVIFYIILMFFQMHLFVNRIKLTDPIGIVILLVLEQFKRASSVFLIQEQLISSNKSGTNRIFLTAKLF